MSGRLQIDLLIGRRIYDIEGEKLGRVDEIRLVREGDAYVVEGLLTGVNGLAERLGIARPLERLERRLNFRHWRMQDHIIYWEQVAHVEKDRILLNVARDQIEVLGTDAVPDAG